MNGKSVIVIKFIILNLILLVARVDAMKIDEFEKVPDTHAFWVMVDSIKNESKESGLPNIDRIVEVLSDYDQVSLENFYFAFRFSSSWVDTGQLFSLALYLKSNRLSDDQYNYLKSCIIFSGSTFFEYVNNEDSESLHKEYTQLLEDLSSSTLECEMYHWVFHDVYESKFGKDIDDYVDISEIAVNSDYSSFKYSDAVSLWAR